LTTNSEEGNAEPPRLFPRYDVGKVVCTADTININKQQSRVETVYLYHIFG